MILKNVASQGVYLFAYNSSGAKTGDSANITGYSSIDGATTGTVLGTANPTEISSANLPGVYWQPLAQSETNGNAIAFSWKSSTSGVSIDPVAVLTTGVSLPAAAYAGDGGLPTCGTNANQLTLGPGGVVSLDLTQTVPTANTAQTVGDALNAARAQGFGKWAISGTTLTLYAGDGITIVRTFTLDSSTSPQQRS